MMEASDGGFASLQEAYDQAPNPSLTDTLDTSGQTLIEYAPTVDMSGASDYYDALRVNVTETNTGDGSNDADGVGNTLQRWMVGGSTKAAVTNLGRILAPQTAGASTTGFGFVNAASDVGLFFGSSSGLTVQRGRGSSDEDILMPGSGKMSLRHGGQVTGIEVSEGSTADGSQETDMQLRRADGATPATLSLQRVSWKAGDSLTASDKVLVVA